MPLTVFLVVRMVHVVAILLWTTVQLLARLALPPWNERARDIGEHLTTAFQRLGGGFLKIGQVLSTRVDLFPAVMIGSLSRLQDAVKPCPIEQITVVIERSLRQPLPAVFLGFDTVPVGCGAIAQVHHGVLRSTGEHVAVKVRRPGIDRLVQMDAAMLRAVASTLAWLPGLREIPVVASVDQVVRAVLRQTDFHSEAAYHHEFCIGFTDADVRVPRLLAEYCTGDVLLSSYAAGSVKVSSRQLDDSVRRLAVTRTLNALYHMIFSSGLVHCDLHPGNILVRDDGSVTIIDCGFAARIDERERVAFARLFLAIAFNDGLAAAEVVLDTAVRVEAGLDRQAFERDVSDLIARVSGARAGQFLVVSFVDSLFRIQRRHGICASPGFSMAILALMVFEGTIWDACPDLDFQKEAVRPLLHALQANPVHLVGHYVARRDPLRDQSVAPSDPSLRQMFE